MSLRKVAGLLLAFGLVLGMIGGGVGAVFTDSATAVQNITVGTFGCTISSTSPGALVTNNSHTVTYTAPDIMASIASTSPFDFTVTSTGSIPVLVSVVATSLLGAPFYDLAGPAADVALNPATPSQTYAAGIGWDTLQNTDLGQTVSITYGITCSEAPVGQTPIDPIYTTQRQGNHAVFVCQYVAPLTLTGIVMIADTNIWPNPGFLIQYPAGNTIGSKAYVLAYNDGQAQPPLSACPLDPYGL